MINIIIIMKLVVVDDVSRLRDVVAFMICEILYLLQMDELVVLPSWPRSVGCILYRLSVLQLDLLQLFFMVDYPFYVLLDFLFALEV